MSRSEPNSVSRTTAAAEHGIRRFTLRDLFALTAICGLLSALAAPAVQVARERSRRDACAANFKNLGFALQNHHDVFKRFPPLSYQGNADGQANVGLMPGSGTSGTSAGYLTTPGTASGYSWIVMILTYLNRTEPNTSIVRTTDDYRREAWSNSVEYQIDFDGALGHFSTLPLDEVICPAYGGPRISTACSGLGNISVSGYSLPATGYRPFYDATRSAPRGVQITNYVALSATTSRFMPDPQSADGTLIPGRGLNMKTLLDGTSKTLVACETKEPAFNSWYDGTTAWTTGMPAGSKVPRGEAPPLQGFLRVPPGEVSALECGPTCLQPDGTPRLYAPAGYTTTGFRGQSGSIAFGPSSDHAGGVVMHLAADASAHTVTTDIDPNLYLQLITRAGGEPVLACCDDRDGSDARER